MSAEIPRRQWEAWFWWVLSAVSVGLGIFALTHFGRPFEELKRSKVALALLSALMAILMSRTIPIFVRVLNGVVQLMVRELTRLLTTLHILRVDLSLKEDKISQDEADAFKGNLTELSYQRKHSERQKRERLAVGVMTREFESSLTKSSVALFLALILVGGYAVVTRDRGMMVMATVIAAFFLLALVRQALLRWRTANGYFGSSEHEVRELLAFAMRHPTPDDFCDGDGHLLPAFDLRPEEAPTTAPVGQAIPGAV